MNRCTATPNSTISQAASDTVLILDPLRVRDSGLTSFTQVFSTVQSIFVAMALNPDIQKKAQAELDAVVGPNRLPDFDQRSLVYVNAIIKEALRWQVVLPFSIPHMTMHDDEFHGYFVPAGTIILPNVWYGSFSLSLWPPTSCLLKSVCGKGLHA